MHSESLQANDALYVRDLLRRRTAVVLDESKDYLIELRLSQLLQETGCQTISELIGNARQSSVEMATKIVEALVTHETLFFRDLYPFDILRKHVLGRLIETRKASRSLTIWSAACSSGQEPYSLAILLLEHFPELASWPVRIIATDISDRVLAKAREGVFQQMEVNRGLPITSLVKYFTRSGLQWQVKPEVRALVEFRQHNLLDIRNLSLRPDIIFMRNVLIYFDLETKRQMLQRARQIIAPDGALFLGSAETTLYIDDDWNRVAMEKSAYYTPSK